MTPDVKKLNSALAAIRKKHGEEVVVDHTSTKDMPRWEPESLALFYLLGGGLPMGRIVEMYGPESSGKSLLANILSADVQRAGGIAGLVDAEFAFDPIFARKFKLDTSKEMFASFQPNYGEQGLAIVEDLVDSEVVGIVTVDSVSALVPRAELEGEMEDQQMGLQARMMGKGLRKLTGKISRTQTTVIFINQIRQKIGVLYGNPETTSGGNALKFFASVRIDVRRKEFIGPKDSPIGQRVRITTRKNKTAPPYRQVIVDILFDGGIDPYPECAEFGIKFGFIKQGGAWYTIGEERIQGKEKVIDYLRQEENKEVFLKIKQQVRDHMKKSEEQLKQEMEELVEELSEVSKETDKTEVSLKKVKAKAELPIEIPVEAKEEPKKTRKKSTKKEEG